MTILFWIVWDSNLKLVIHMFGMVRGHIFGFSPHLKVWMVICT